MMAAMVMIFLLQETRQVHIGAGATVRRPLLRAVGTLYFHKRLRGTCVALPRPSLRFIPGESIAAPPHVNYDLQLRSIHRKKDK